MIQISSEGDYDSVKKIDQIVLNDFSVIIGINGAGKTQFLKGLGNGNISAEGMSDKQIQYFNFSDFQVNSKDSNVVVNNEFYNKIINQRYFELQAFTNSGKRIEGIVQEAIILYFKNGPIWSDEDKRNVMLFKDNLDEIVAEKDKYPGLLSDSMRAFLQIYRGSYHTYSNLDIEPLEKKIFENVEEFKSFYVENRSDLTKEIELSLGGKSIFEIEPSDVTPFSLLLQDIAESEKQFQWEYALGRTSKGEKSPVEDINEILSEYGHSYYRLTSTRLPEQLGISYDPIKLMITLHRPHDNLSTTFDKLSTGEKILIALSFMIYQSSRKSIYIKLLLLDEIDSFLHPLMIKHFVEVLKNTFARKGISVIMTTHSPTTVALCNESEVYSMESGILKSTTRDKALNMLTVGIPTLSIDYENRKQVFVESSKDVYYYSELYKTLQSHLKPEVSLNFIDSGFKERSGNCDHVVNFVEQLTKYGNKKIYGIIDWDRKSHSKIIDQVKIIGHGKRYSIENFLLDPLYIALLLIKYRKWDSVFGGDIRMYEVQHYSQAELQSLSDKVHEKILPHLNVGKENTEQVFIDSAMVAGAHISTSLIITNYKGHEYESILLDNIHQLKMAHNAENKEFGLKGMVVNLLDDYPAFIFQDYLDLFRSIQATA